MKVLLVNKLIIKVLKYHIGICTICLLLFYNLGLSQTSPTNLPKVGMGLAEVNYYLPHHPFNDAIKTVRWRDVASWDSNGFPASANSGRTVEGRIGAGNGNHLDSGEYVLTWEGDGEVTSTIGTLVSEDLQSNPKRRVYNIDVRGRSIRIRVRSFPATNIKLWIPGQENSSSLWNPDYLCYLDGVKGGVFRFMNMEKSNESSQKDWSDRTPRNWSTYVNQNNNSAGHSIKGAVAYEAMIEFANEMQTDMWICFPHLVSDEYVRNLAHLIKTGVDLSTGEQTTQPLNSNLAVWLEYSNEVWNTNFSQTHWVNDNLPGSNLDEKYALKSVEMFNTFKSQFGDDDRIIRVLSTHTVNGTRTRNRLNMVDRSEYDVLAITTYFQYDYHNYIYNNWNNGALTHEDFYNYIVSQMGSGVFRKDEPRNSGIARTYEQADLLNVPVVTYEGNEHFNMIRKVDTDNDGRADTQIQNAAPGSLAWMHDFARSDYMYNLLERFQLRHEASGLKTHVPYVSASGWSQYGQWGYAEYVGQPMSEATKYRWLHDHFNLDYPCTDTSSSYLNISDSSIDLEHSSEEVTVEVTSNIDWSVSSSQSWITIDSNSGTANSSVTINVLENTTSEDRTGTIIFTGADVSDKTLSITQSGVSACEGAEFIETFNDTNLELCYTFDSFIGTNDTEWEYSNAMKGEAIEAGDSNTILLNKNGAKLSATIRDGISAISAVCMKAGGAGDGALDLKVNGEIVASYFSSANDIITITATGLEANPNDNVEFVTTAGRPIIIDDIRIVSCLESSASLSGEIGNQNNILNMYPNPISKGNIIVETKGFDRPTIEVYRMLGGKTIYRKENLSRFATINIDNMLKPGIYIVRIFDKTTEKTRKLIVE